MKAGSRKKRSEGNDRKRSKALWRQYRFDPADLAARNALIEHHLPIAEILASKFAKKCPVGYDELFAAATDGLMDAVEGFDLERGFSFATYATPRIRGAMLDYLRSLDFAPQLARRRQAARDRTAALLTERFNRRPTPQEIEDELPADTFFEKIPAVVSLEEIIRFERESEKARSLREIVPARPRTLNGDDFSLLAAYLGEEDRVAVYLHFFKDITMHTVGLILGYTESRISQRISMALARLKALKSEELRETLLAKDEP